MTFCAKADFALNRGEACAQLGEDILDKTTLLRAVCGLLDNCFALLN